MDFINVNIDAVAIIQVSTEKIQLAAKNYIGKTADQIGASVAQTLSGCLREAIGTVEFKELNLNRDAFSKTVMKNATTDISELGLEILSCNIERVDEGTDLVESLGADNTWKIRKDAAMTAAEADRSIRETKAEAERAAQEAEIKSKEQIAIRENEFKVKQAELKKQADKQNAEADAVYKIGEAEQLAVINTKMVDAEIAKTLRQQELSKQEVIIKENSLRSTVNAEADAAKYKQITEAAAELEQAKQMAEARKAQAEAEAIRLTGVAEAEAIRQKGVAEALQAKAEAYEKFGNAAIMDMVVKILPQMAENIAKPISAIESVRIYGGDGNGVSSLSGNVPNVLAQTFDTLESVGVPVKEMLAAKTKAAQTDKNINVTGLPELALD